MFTRSRQKVLRLTTENVRHLEQEGAEITGDMLFAKSADFALAKQKQPEMAVKFNEMKTNHP